jgi:hypothetical protein
MIGLVRLIVLEPTGQLTTTNMEGVVSTIWELQERMTAKMDAWLEGVEACVRKLEVNREKSEAVAKHQDVPNEKAAVVNIGGLVWGPASGRTAPQMVLFPYCIRAAVIKDR